MAYPNVHQNIHTVRIAWKGLQIGHCKVNAACFSSQALISFVTYYLQAIATSKSDSHPMLSESCLNCADAFRPRKEFRDYISKFVRWLLQTVSYPSKCELFNCKMILYFFIHSSVITAVFTVLRVKSSHNPSAPLYRLHLILII